MIPALGSHLYGHFAAGDLQRQRRNISVRNASMIATTASLSTKHTMHVLVSHVNVLVSHVKEVIGSFVGWCAY